MPRKNELPNNLLIFENLDKVGTTSPFNPNDLADFPSPFTLVLCAPTSSGKTSLIKNIILHQRPAFERIVIYHFDPDTLEYGDIDAEIISRPPEKSDFEKGVKTLLIIEDINMSLLSKIQRAEIDRVFGYISSHLGVSVILTSQTLTNVPLSIRRMASALIVWKGSDRRCVWVLSQMLGISKRDLEFYFDSLKTKYDFLLLSNFPPPYPRITKNLYEVVRTEY